MSPEPTVGFKENAEDLNTAADVQFDLNGPTPLTEAEQAAADVMRECETEGVITTADPESFDRTVRAVVAAVRPLLAAEALERFADKVDALPPANEFRDGAYWHRNGLRGAASLAREEAAALRTTTPEDTK